MTTRRSESGQSLVIVALLLVSLIGLLAIVIDGGFAYLLRREAQNAADAGALAGAREWCNSKDADLAVTRALEYAVDRNGALEADASLTDGQLSVTTRMPFNTAFGTVLGVSEITAGAVADAGCFVPGSATGVLPIAWSCRAGDPYLPDGTCQTNFESSFIVMDSAKASEDHCAPVGTLDCDFDDDGRLDILRGGDRSWLDLSGRCGGGSCLPDWIENGVPFPVDVHTWYPGQTGDPKPIYEAAKAREGEDVIVPIFNRIWKGDPTVEFDNPADKHSPAGPCGSGSWCYHIIGFAMFHIDCVSRKPGDKCPVKDAAIAAGMLANKDSSIEGHFYPGGVVPGLSGQAPADGPDMGIYTLYLTR